LPRAFFDRPVLDVAPELLGKVLERDHPDGVVALRLTEVEAYAGGIDPASHAYRGQTARNATMFGPPGHAYVYFTYGMHYCVNLVCGPSGMAAAVLLRAGAVCSGVELARIRRPGAVDRDLARGPARLTRTLAVDRALDGADVTSRRSPLRILAGEPVDTARIRTGPRVGITHATAAGVPWRFWLTDEPTVSNWRAGDRNRRRGSGP
jgi:DNA-3-methyladenine glycosylase